MPPVHPPVTSAGGDPERILDALDPEQRAAAEAWGGPVVIWAGAGTGKTRAITHRIAYGVASDRIEPGRTLAVTFTARAAGEMRERLRHLGVEGVPCRTFHAAALRQLRYFWPRAYGVDPPQIIDRVGPLVAEAAGRCRLPTEPAVIRDLIAEIAWCKQVQCLPDGYPALAAGAGRTPPVSLADLARVYATYDEVKSARSLMDFDDVLLLLVGLLVDRSDIADQVRAGYRTFTVDEFQDVSPLQARVLDLWLGERDDLCVVGDPMQTIYSFAGARASYLTDFAQRYPHATQVRLVRTYRSTDPIVDLANRVVTAAAPGTPLLRGQSGAGPAPTVVEHPDETAEARAVAAWAGELIARGTPARDIAVLMRINAQMPAVEEAFAEAGIPTVLRGGERFFERPAVKEALTRLRGAARSGELGDISAVQAVQAVLSAMGHRPEPPRGSGAVRERWESLASITSLAADLGSASLADVVAELDRRAQIQHAPVADGVTLATIHAAKGLEWQAVAVIGLVDGTLPYQPSDSDDAAIAEERRLFYVAVTRARRDLMLTWARARQPGGRGSRTRSRFVDQAMPGSASRRGSTGPGPGSGRRGKRAPARCRSCGQALVTGPERVRGRCRSCPSTLDEALVDRLKQWRRQAAQERGVPAFVIFTDATLEALVEARPDDTDGLLAVSGIGPDKVRRYGEDLLALLAPGPQHADVDSAT